MKKNIITIILLFVFGVLIFQVIRFFSISSEYYTAQKAYETLNNDVIIKGQDNEAATEGTTESDIPMDIDFNALKEINKDIVAWIYVRAVDISYPVLYSGDNDYYLRRGFDGEYLISGSVFVEGLNSPDFSDPHTIIYGHNMRDGSMFSSLEELYTKDYIQTDNTFWIITETYAYQYQIFSLNYVLNTSSVYTIFCQQDDAIIKYIENRIADSLLNLDIPTYSQDAKIVTLSTCGPLSGTQRFVVQGILVKTLELS